MWKYLIYPKCLTWYQKLYLSVYNWYLYFFRVYPKPEALVYKDKGIKGYIRYMRGNIILHIKKRNRNKIFNRWNNEYFKL